MKRTITLVLTYVLISGCNAASAQNLNAYQAIFSGVPWFDDKGSLVSAHAAGIIKDNGRYYLFGEKHADADNAFAGFNCYSSSNLCNWKFERIALPVQDSGKLGPNRVGERPKVMKCPKTGQYVMFMHTDDLTYKDQAVGYATSTSIAGPYIFKGPLLLNGKPIRKWDMGTFQDTDGSGYVLTHGGVIYKLADDYTSITELVIDNKWPGSEAPAIIKKNGVYFWLTSHLSSWERNDNYYFTATSLNGPWTSRGIFAPQGSLTWNSQTTFVLAIQGTQDTTFMFMGDRWSFPHQASSATYVWQPLSVTDTTLSLQTYHEAWAVNTITGSFVNIKTSKKIIKNTDKKSISYSGNWSIESLDSLTAFSADTKGASFTVKFTGTQIGFYAIGKPNGGYAKFVIQNNKGNVILSGMMDMYCKFPDRSLKFMSPVLSKNYYKLTVSVMGEHSKWSDKKKNEYGSTGNFVSLDKIVITD